MLRNLPFSCDSCFELTLIGVTESQGEQTERNRPFDAYKLSGNRSPILRAGIGDTTWINTDEGQIERNNAELLVTH